MMEFVHHASSIRIILVEYEFAFTVPPEPVLHNVVGRNVQLPILAGDAEDFLLRLVPILALPKTVSPLAEQGRLAGEFTVTSDNLVETGTIEKIIVDDVGDFRADVEIVCEPVVEAA